MVVTSGNLDCALISILTQYAIFVVLNPTLGATFPICIALPTFATEPNMDLALWAAMY